jgi:hypothetical protein
MKGEPKQYRMQLTLLPIAKVSSSFCLRAKFTCEANALLRPTDNDSAEWDLPPKPKGMGWAIFERWVARYDAEDTFDAQLVMATARLMKRLSERL